jgi:hypothetical protein
MTHRFSGVTNTRRTSAGPRTAGVPAYNRGSLKKPDCLSNKREEGTDWGRCRSFVGSHHRHGRNSFRNSIDSKKEDKLKWTTCRLLVNHGVENRHDRNHEGDAEQPHVEVSGSVRTRINRNTDEVLEARKIRRGGARNEVMLHRIR